MISMKRLKIVNINLNASKSIDDDSYDDSKEMLENINIKHIQKFLRDKKLKEINKDNNGC